MNAERWAELTPAQQETAVAQLRAYFQPSWFDQVRGLIAADPSDWYVPYHFGVGMAVRNLLRTGVLGDVATGVPGILDRDLPSGNWDDYYVEVIEAAVA